MSKLTIKELFYKVRAEMEDSPAKELFEEVLSEFVAATDKTGAKGWDEEEISAEECEAIYSGFITYLHVLIMSRATSIDDPIYENATNLAATLRGIFEDEVGVKLRIVTFMGVPTAIGNLAIIILDEDGGKGFATEAMDLLQQAVAGVVKKIQKQKMAERN